MAAQSPPDERRIPLAGGGDKEISRTQVLTPPSTLSYYQRPVAGVTIRRYRATREGPYSPLARPADSDLASGEAEN